MSAIDTNHFRELLLEERQRVVAAIENLEKDHQGSLSDETGEDAVFDNHLGDTATETYDRELDYTLEENSENVLGDIDAALKRIEDGTYGICTEQGRADPAGAARGAPVGHAVHRLPARAGTSLTEPAPPRRSRRARRPTA